MRVHDVVIAVLVGAVLAILSIPYRFEFSYWAESPTVWVVYALVGVLASVTALYLFFWSQRLMLSGGSEEMRTHE